MLVPVNKPIKSVSVLAWVVENNTKKYCIITNKKRKGLEFPGGKIEKDEDVVHAAIREFEEEFGKLSETFKKKFAAKPLFSVLHKINEQVYNCLVFSFGDITNQITINTEESSETEPVYMDMDSIRSSLDKFTFKEINVVAFEIVNSKLDIQPIGWESVDQMW